MIDRDQVLHVAKLARLRLSDEEVDRMAGELSKILEHVEKLEERILALEQRIVGRLDSGHEKAGGEKDR